MTDRIIVTGLVRKATFHPVQLAQLFANIRDVQDLALDCAQYEVAADMQQASRRLIEYRPWLAEMFKRDDTKTIEEVVKLMNKERPPC